jgi:molecular chaperone GrpE
MSTNLEHDPAAVAPGQDTADPAVAADAELAVAQAQLQEAREAQLRALAEMENVRKRAQRDVESAHRFAVERFAADMIEVRDTLELGLAAAGAAPEAAKFVEGAQATLRMVDKAFERAGIAVMDPVGQGFNPEFHEDHPVGSVMAVVQKGFTLNGRLLRPARVVIARSPDPAS